MESPCWPPGFDFRILVTSRENQELHAALSPTGISVFKFPARRHFEFYDVIRYMCAATGHIRILACIRLDLV